MLSTFHFIRQILYLVYYLCIINFSQEAHDILSITRTHNKNMIIDILSITRTHKKNIIDDIISITRTHKKNMIIDILSITRTHCLLSNFNYFFYFTIRLKNVTDVNIQYLHIYQVQVIIQ